MNYENDNHQHTEYVRPSKKYRCGRAARWGKPCWQGPDGDKKCGGTNECSPVRRGDRYYCQRPKSAGGACVEGPLPDGACAHTHLPCRPHVSIRELRGKLSLFGILIIVILLALFSNRGSESIYNEMINPGTLSSSHAGFPVTDKCENCHQAHDQPASSWLMSAFKHQDMTKQCVQCHAFNGEATAPHNKQFDDEKNTKLECISCHREHKGSAFEISNISNQTCSNCHQESFAQFTGHSDFPEHFPHQKPQNIFFDHAKHLAEYFVEDKWINKPGRDAALAKKARSECQFCHQVESAQRDIPIRDYATSCGGCHEQQIKKRMMTILTADEASPALIMLLTNTGQDDEEIDIDEFTAKLINDLASDGFSAVSEKLDETGVKQKRQQQLFDGLDSTLLEKTATQWLNEDDLEMDDSEQSGWQVAENDDGAEAILYRPEGHGDNVMRNWIELYLHKARSNELANEVLLELLDIEAGPGACGKCHGSMAGVSSRQEQPQTLSLWGKTATQERIYTPGFSHRPHIDLLGESQGCDACHKLSDDADYPAYFKQSGEDTELFQSAFNSIKVETCVQCHNPERISDDCQLCHVYHNGAGFKFEYQKREMKVVNP